MKLDLETLKSAFQKVSESKKRTQNISKDGLDTIKDEEIVDLSKTLKSKAMSVDELLGNS